MAKRKYKEIRIKFLSISLVVTLVTLIILQLLLFLHRENFIELPTRLIAILGNISLVIAVLFFSSLLLRLTIKRIARFFDEPEEKIFYSKIYSWTIYTIGIFYILGHFGVSPGNITIFVGLLATGLAFAVRDVLLSFFGWIILLRKKPFRIGDYIKIGEDEGTVEHIGTFFVLLDKAHEFPEGYTRVPNRLFLEKSITKLGKNKLHEHIFFLLAGIPENKSEMLSHLKDDIQQLLTDKEFILPYIDMRNEKLYLDVEYQVSFNKKQEIRSNVVDLVFKHFGAFLVLPKN